MKYVINKSLIYDPSSDEIIALCTSIHICWLETKNMRFELRAMVLFGVALAGITEAAPLTPSDLPDITLKIAGSTIQDNNIDKVLKGPNGNDGLCISGTLSTYKDADIGGQGTFWRAWFCQLDNNRLQGLGQVNPKLLVLKRNRSGAVTGLYPLLEPNKKIQFMGITNSISPGQCTLTSGSTTAYTCRTSQVGDLFPDIPDAGMLDVDPGLLRDSNFSASIDDQTYREPDPTIVAATLNVINAGAVIQNTPVSKNLRDALQAAQIAQGTIASSCLKKETLDCMPSLSKATLSDLFAGNIAKWTEVLIDVGGKSTPLTEFAQSPLTTDLVHLCRRNLGASTQAAVNAYFLNNPCTPGARVPVNISNPTIGPVVLAPSQVSLEEICLDNLSGGRSGVFNPKGNTAFAVGMLTTERNLTLSLDYRYIKIDGFAPTVQEVYNGNYPYFTEGSYVFRKRAPKPSGDLLTVLNRIANDASSPQVFGALNASINQTFGTGTYIATTGQGYPSPTVFDPLNPLTAYTHQPRGSLLDNCRGVIKQ